MSEEISSSPPTPKRKSLIGPTYIAYIHDLLRKRNARNYMEVGVRAGLCLAGVECPAIGIDPNFIFDRNPMGKKRALHLFQMTSDEFFAEHDPTRIFGAAVDVAFLDGLHQFEYLLRDFINTEKHCGRNSLVLLDDCLPINIEMTERLHNPAARVDREIAEWWTGDVWKVVSILREYRPDLRVVPVDVRPTGSMGISNLDPTSTVLEDRYFEIVDRYHAVALGPAEFEAYWATNRPLNGLEILKDFEMSRYFKV
ncbi:MAG: class I SAM-dependent methyltransferase [Pseudomonadota bacterium]